MESVYQDTHVTVYCADVLEALRALPEKSVHCCVTSPPYFALRDYKLPPSIWDATADCQHEWDDAPYVRRSNDNKRHKGTEKQWTNAGSCGRDNPVHSAFCGKCGAWSGVLGLEPEPGLYVRHLVQVCREIKRVLRDDGTFWLNLGDSHAGSWGNYGGGNRGKGGGQREITTGSKCHQVAYDGLEGLRPPTSNKMGNIKPKDLIGIPWAVAFALREDGWWLRSDIVYNKVNALPESVEDRCTRSHEYIFMLAKSKHYFYDHIAVLEEFQGKDERKWAGSYDESGSILQGESNAGVMRTKRYPSTEGRNRRSVWSLPTAVYVGAHYASFPEALVETPIKAGTSEYGCCAECGAPYQRKMLKPEMPDSALTELFTQWVKTCHCATKDVDKPVVLDPFCGTGTTLWVAKKLGRQSIGIDLSTDFCDLTTERNRQQTFL